MKTKITLTKKDCVVVFVCSVFLLMCMGAIGGGSRKHAKDIVCRANLRQWSLAMTEFTNDNGGSIWTGLNWQNFNASNWWMPALNDYHGDDIDKIRFCPTTKTKYAEDGVTHGPGYGKEPFTAWGYNNWLDSISPEPDCNAGSYGVNGWIHDSPDEINTETNIPKYWRNINRISSADTVPFLLDAQWIDAWPEPSNAPSDNDNWNWESGGSHMVRIVQNRHNDAQNCAFMDGTVRSVGLKELWTLKWHREFNIAGPYTTAGGATAASWPGWMQDMEAY